MADMSLISDDDLAEKLIFVAFAVGLIMIAVHVVYKSLVAVPWAILLPRMRVWAVSDAESVYRRERCSHLSVTCRFTRL